MNIEKNNKKSTMMEEFNKKKELMNLQQKYEKGLIKEKDITEEQKKELLKLYEEQIKTLKENSENYKNSLKMYKEKIIGIRKKLSKN